MMDAHSGSGGSIRQELIRSSCSLSLVPSLDPSFLPSTSLPPTTAGRIGPAVSHDVRHVAGDLPALVSVLGELEWTAEANRTCHLVVQNYGIWSDETTTHPQREPSWLLREHAPGPTGPREDLI